MDFGYTPEQEALRQEVRAFIKQNMTRELVFEPLEFLERLAAMTPTTTSHYTWLRRHKSVGFAR